MIGPQRSFGGNTEFTHDGHWLVSVYYDDRFNGGHEVSFYALGSNPPATYAVLDQETSVRGTWFTADGQTLATYDALGNVSRHSVTGDAPSRTLWTNPAGRIESATLSPSRSHVLVNGFSSQRAWIVPLDGSPVVDLGDLQAEVGGVALEANGRRAAVGGGNVRPRMPDEPVIRVIDLETGGEQILRGDGESGYLILEFLPHDRLLALSIEGIFLWDLTTGTAEALTQKHYDTWWVSDLARGQFAIRSATGVDLWDLESRALRSLPIPSNDLTQLSLIPDERLLLAGTSTGKVLVLELESGVQHELVGHDGAITALWISPDGERVQSASEDGTVRVWKRPRGKPADHLPHPKFLALLKAQTNMRAIPDVNAEEGYRIEYDAFPGWADLPPAW
jgi:WD40 repeat protein